MVRQGYKQIKCGPLYYILQCEPENCGIGRRLLHSSYGFKYLYNEHETRQQCEHLMKDLKSTWYLFAFKKPEIH